MSAPYVRGFAICLTLAVAPLVAQPPTLTNLVVDNISHASARLSWTGSVPVNRQIAFDTQASWNGTNSYRYQTGRLDDFETTQYMNLTGLQPGTT